MKAKEACLARHMVVERA
uniref:Uncharacterized protein n=1 Tax=Vitis vinifera TaxID=29760 RepID=F6GVW1_VITVI